MHKTSGFESAVFYYMSGTGNSFRTAVWAAEELKAKNKTRIIPFEKAVIKGSAPSKETLTGLFFPTHAFTAPWPAIKFALSMPFSKGTPLFIIATRGGAFYPFPLPGMEGTACLVIALILALKGYDVRGFSGMDMPVNWLAVHWGMNKAHAEYFYAKAQKELSVLISKLNSGKRIYKSIPSWIIGILLLQVSFMYVIFARLMLAKIMFADETCNNCGICEKYCPYKAIKMLGGKNKKPYWTFSCESCERCIAYCPKKSIQAGHSYLFLLYWFFYGVLGFIPVKIAADYGIFKTGLWAMALSIGYTLAFYYIGYWILNLLSRTALFAWLFSHTTFTKIYRRYNQHGTGLNDLKNGTEI
jgi:Pyruvate/2-oxoacid:ferredoxin oxidoreductase delta subunit